MAKKQLVDVLIGAARRHGLRGDDQDREINDLQGLVQLCWSLLTTEQREAVGIAALDAEGLGLARWMRPRELRFGNVTARRD